LTSLPTLLEWRRLEKDQPAMQVPVPLEEIHKLLRELREVFLSQPVPDPDGEYAAARECMEDICRIRRDKLARAAIINEPPPPRQLWDFESYTWFGFQHEYQTIDAAYKGVHEGRAPPDMMDYGKTPGQIKGEQERRKKEEKAAAKGKT
jgi:hypothetical protein